jgi:HK97 gp10 family phage protein
MGKFDFEIPKDFLKKLNKLENVDEVSKKMVNEAVPILKDAIKAKVKSDYSSPGRKVQFIREDGLDGMKLGERTQTGGLLKSVKMSKAKILKNGSLRASVYFSGKDKNGTPNAMKATILEFGRKNQVARPFITKVVKNKEAEVLAKMQEVFEREIK